MRKIFFLLLISSTVFAQKSIHNYKYVVVKKQFDFVKESDQYQTSSLTKFLFNKNGFTAFMEGENFPEDLLNDRCTALTASVKKESKLFTTKNVIELKDCFNNLIFSSSEGLSREKDFKKAYHEAIRNAFVSVKALNYNYNPLKQEKTSTKVKEKKDTQKEIKAENENPFVNPKLTVLYANPFNKGFKLLNDKKELTFTVVETKLKNIFIIKQKNGIFYKENYNWVAEFYDSSGNKIIKEYDVRMVDKPK